MRVATLRLRVGLVLWAWLAQLCLPVAHAALMSEAPARGQAWCGASVQALAFVAELPAELRDALDDGQADVHALDACARLCAVATTPPPLAAPAPIVALRAAGLEPPAPPRDEPAGRSPSLRPPSHGPPARA